MKLNNIIELNSLIKETLTLNPNLKNIQVSGEINDFSINKGNVYFKLKDESASISAVIWKNNAVNINRELYHDGVKIDVTGNVNSWEKNASISFQIFDYKISGEGDIKKLFAERLSLVKANGWDDFDHKKIVKSIPENIAIISTVDGDGLRDVINTIKRKNNIVNIFVFPSSVQGDKAAKELIDTINRVEKLSGNKIPLIETILLVRGGGSAEDLWCFNDLNLAKKIYDCKIPIISGIGHQPDETIADYVSDLRAITPTDAGNKSIVDKSQLYDHIDNFKKQGAISILSRLELNKTNINATISSLTNSQSIIKNKITIIKNELNNIISNKNSLIFKKISDNRNSIVFLKESAVNLGDRLISKLYNYRSKLLNLNKDMSTHILNSINSTKMELEYITSLFGASDPKRPLEKGYVIVSDINKKILKSKNQIHKNDIYNIEFADGIAKVKGE